MRVKITISYDGSRFNGFQIQNNKQKVITVAGLITKELNNLNIKTILIGSGRTDTGVHASSQVLHFEIPEFWSNITKLKDELNRLVKPYIYIKKIEIVDKKFHARFSAKKRLYRYALYSGEYQPFLSNYALHVDNMDVEKLDSIVKHFIGIHDFTNFKKQGSETSSDIREIFKAGTYRHKGITIIYFLGNSFLRSQIRMMCGFALEVMNDKLTSTQLKEQLNKEKKHSTKVIPATGLYLAKIFY